jgi:predicted hydrocarbon binding protein
MENMFLKLLESGYIQFNEDQLLILSAFQIILPVSVFLKLQQFLMKISPSKSKKILKELGRYQFDQSFARYKKVLKIEQLSVEKIVEFFSRHASLMGFGKFKLIKFQKKPLQIILANSNNPISVEYKILYGKSKKPIDDYFSGLLEGAYTKFLKKKIECKETLCIAKGDKVCQFVISEKKS